MAGRLSPLITHSAFRPISDPQPSAGTPILRKSFMASRIPGLQRRCQAALCGAVNCLQLSGTRPALESESHWLHVGLGAVMERQRLRAMCPLPA